MVFYIIGLGLGNEKDISVKGYEVIQKCEEIYLEAYTSILGVQKEKLEEFYKKKIIEADRDMCEQKIDDILENLSKTPERNVAFLVVGDPFCATTHSDLYLRAVQLKIPVEIIHNASIINAIGCTGCQVYRFGECVSIPYFTEKWKPMSFYPKLLANKKQNLHTLCLLDIKVKERSEENLIKGKDIFEPPRFMSCKEAVEQLYECAQAQKDNNSEDYIAENTKCFGVARVGFENQLIVSGTLKDFLNIDMGSPLHSFVVCADELHPIEEEMYNHYHFSNQKNTQQLQQQQ
ncbi:Tetrapyrrole methylase [Pseudocohnilembus persalinus]|uniref:diphthine methyl ester synthase n=1 Tax=Pseudocohnilembus persalinus TaxID=266149 RepID=A0A0V0QQD8_PSEPJ|nr:Tetrapyrrole methylase [Pseudocohnilembus persalinus]|eukprot:KRX04343.1 Tetrapyrrole methylase [Pseudocohnilembus persalinus]